LIIFQKHGLSKPVTEIIALSCQEFWTSPSEIVREYGFQIEIFCFASVVISKGMSKSENAPSAASQLSQKANQLLRASTKPSSCANSERPVKGKACGVSRLEEIEDLYSVGLKRMSCYTLYQPSFAV
jgi:hypothetical protein